MRITGNNSEFQGAKINDKNTFRLPRQDLKRPKEMAEISHLWAEWYLIYTPFTHFEGELPDENNDTAVICYTWIIADIL